MDLLLHPLRSELNFPVGNKFDLDLSEGGERWGLPIFLFDALFYGRDGRQVVLEDSKAAQLLLDRLSAVLAEGYAAKALQRTPHAILLNKDFYHAKIKPVMAEWTYMWLQKEHLAGISKTEALQYLTQGAAAQSDAARKITSLQHALKRRQIKLGLVPPTLEKCENPSEIHTCVRRHLSADLEGL